MSQDPMGDRFKGYEAAAEQVLPCRLPVIVRLDGNSFSRFTKANGFQKPFDERFERAMEAAARAVLEYASGAQLAYLQSDEITVLLRNDQTLATEPFLANRTQKLASLLAATASVAFNASLRGVGLETSAVFDARAFVVPRAEVVNAFLWRQNDCFKNAISSYAYWGLAERYGRKTARRMLHGKGLAERQEIIFQELGVNPNDLKTEWKRGRTLIRVTREVPLSELMCADVFRQRLDEGHIEEGQTALRSEWVVDREIPRFHHEPDYIERFLLTEEELEESHAG